MAYDDAISLLGDFGRYQKRIYFLLCLPAILCTFHKMGTVFLNASPEYRCKIPGEYSNASYNLPEEIVDSFFVPDNSSQKLDACFIDLNNETYACDQYIYDKSTYVSSTVIEWNLVCSDAYLKATGDAIFMFGVLVGSIIFGYLSDRYGRKIIFFVSLIIQVVFGLLAAVAPEFWTYTMARAVIGSSTSGVFLVAYVIAMEMVGPKKRLVTGVICQLFCTAGYLLVAGFAYSIDDWRMLQISLTLPGVAFFCYWWFIPESPRWLLSKNRLPEAIELIQVAAKENKVTIPDKQLESLLKSDTRDKTQPKATFLDIFKHARMRNRSLIIFLDWLTINTAYYGLSWHSSNLGGNGYVNFVLSGLVEIPAYTILYLTLNKWGRKPILCGSMIAAGIFLFLTMFVPADQQWLTVTLAMLGKLCITGSVGTIYIFSTEQFPTTIRNAGLGAGSTCGRIGATCAPLINVTAEIWKPMPLIIFGVGALIGGCFSIFLPETLDMTLPETIADCEQFGKKQQPASEEEEKLNSQQIGS